LPTEEEVSNPDPQKLYSPGNKKKLILVLFKK
jgi:hypothetical protein